jgi:hypothetical protein
VLVVVAGYLSSCTAAPRAVVVPHLSLLASVVRGRFVTRVELGNGNLVVEPAGKSRARVSARAAEAQFRAADVVDGSYQFAVLGLGLVTISPDVPTTTTPGATTTSGPTTTSTTTTTTTTTTTATTTTTIASTTTPAPGSTTSSAAASTTTSTAATPPVPAPTPPLPHYDSRLAWVGIVWGAGCPGSTSGPHSPVRYVAVVFDADTGRSAVAYASRGPASCNGPVVAPSVSRPDELVSVPWQPVGPSSTAVRVTMPACSAYFGWTEVPGAGGGSIQVVASTPFDPDCGSTASSVQVVDNVVPLGNSQAQLLHAALGPVDGLRTLAGG